MITLAFLMLILRTLFMPCLNSANDVTPKCYYTSVILVLLNGFITLLHHVLCNKMTSVARVLEFLEFYLILWLGLKT